MTMKIKQQIEKLVDNSYAGTYVSYHPNYRYFHLVAKMSVAGQDVDPGLNHWNYYVQVTQFCGVKNLTT